MPSKLTRAEFTILAAGVALVVGSFAPFYSCGGLQRERLGLGPRLSPIALYPVFAGVASAGVIALRHFANAQLAVRLGSFTWEQVHVLLGFLALSIAVGLLLHRPRRRQLSGSASGCCSADRSRCSPARSCSPGSVPVRAATCSARVTCSAR